MARCRRFPRPYAGIASRVTWYLQWPKIQRLSPPRMAITSRSLPFHRSSRGRTPPRSAGRRSAVTPRRLGGPGAFGDTAEAAGAEGGDREGTSRGWASPLHSDREGDRGGGQAAEAGSSRSPGFPSHAARRCPLAGAAAGPGAAAPSGPARQDGPSGRRRRAAGLPPAAFGRPEGLGGRRARVQPGEAVPSPGGVGPCPGAALGLLWEPARSAHRRGRWRAGSRAPRRTSPGGHCPSARAQTWVGTNT